VLMAATVWIPDHSGVAGECSAAASRSRRPRRGQVPDRRAAAEL